MKSELDLLLLAVLRGRPRHGYELIAALRDRSGGTFDLPEGTVYPALHKLERDGVVASEWDVVDGRRRRVYSLTAEGAKALASRRHTWASYAAAVNRVIGAPA